MEIRAVQHRSHGLDCFPIDDHSFNIRLRTASGDCDSVYIEYSLNRFDWYLGRTCKKMQLAYSGSLYDYFEIQISGQDTRLAYIFRLESSEETLYLSEEGISTSYNYDYGHYSYFQYPSINAVDVHELIPWAQKAVVYQIFPERFCMGMKGKDYLNGEWGDIPTPKSFLGGDLVGVMQKLPYLVKLGVNTLYFTPVGPSPSNHKYDVIDYYHVDAAFGGDDALTKLVSSAHALGLRVILDGVFNHCSSNNPIFLDVVEKGRASTYWDWFTIDGDKPECVDGVCNYLTFASVPYMPKLNTSNPRVIEYFCSVGSYWIEHFDSDGWRLDVADELSFEFLRAFRRSVKAVKSDALIVCEVWHEPAAWLMGDTCDGVMQYGFTKACIDYLADESIDAIGFTDRLISVLWRISPQAAAMSFTLLDSHDTHRFLTLVNGSIERLKMAYALAFFYIGMPFVYYGDEVGMVGGYDPDCRRCFPWDDSLWNTELLDFIKGLIRLKARPCMQNGRLGITCENGTVAVTRSTADEKLKLEIKRDTGHCAVYEEELRIL